MVVGVSVAVESSAIFHMIREPDPTSWGNCPLDLSYNCDLAINTLSKDYKFYIFPGDILLIPVRLDCFLIFRYIHISFLVSPRKHQIRKLILRS
jgi:hypothetical protein